jgi:hypothetical protein
VSEELAILKTARGLLSPRDLELLFGPHEANLILTKAARMKNGLWRQTRWLQRRAVADVSFAAASAASRNGDYAEVKRITESCGVRYEGPDA